MIPRPLRQDRVWHVTAARLPKRLALKPSGEAASWEGVALSVSTCPGRWVDAIGLSGDVYELAHADGTPGQFVRVTPALERSASAWARREGWLRSDGEVTRRLLERWFEHFRAAGQEPEDAHYFAREVEPVNLYITRRWPDVDGLWWPHETEAGPPRGSILPHALERWEVSKKTPVASWDDARCTRDIRRNPQTPPNDEALVLYEDALADGVLVELWDDPDGKAVGTILARRASDSDCIAARRKVGSRVGLVAAPGFAAPFALAVHDASLHPSMRGKGLGAWLYAECARMAWVHWSAMIIAHDCTPGGATSYDAQQAWRSRRLSTYVETDGRFAAVWRLLDSADVPPPPPVGVSILPLESVPYRRALRP